MVARSESVVSSDVMSMGGYRCQMSDVSCQRGTPFLLHGSIHHGTVVSQGSQNIYKKDDKSDKNVSKSDTKVYLTIFLPAYEAMSC